MTKKIITDYIDESDWRTKENSNDGRSISGLKSHVVGSALAKHALDIAVGKHEHISGKIHIHDLRGSIYSSYCCGHDLRELLLQGIGIESGVQSRPAKHLDVVVDHIGNYLQILSNEWEGAQAFSSVDSYFAPFIYEDNLSQKEVDQQMERLVYGLNFESRAGFQSAFTNLSFDWTVQDDMKDVQCIVGGELKDYTYGDMQEYLDMINIGFLKTLISGDSNGKVFTFPIPTYSVRDESMFIDTDQKTNLLWELTAKFGSPYFSNYLGSGINPNTIRSMCCRLQLDTEEIAQATSGIWDKGVKTGSLAIVSINLNRIALESNTIDEYISKLEDMVCISTEQLLQRKEYILHAFNNGLMPYTKKYIQRLDTFFLTVGIVGAYEAYINMNEIDESYFEFTTEIISTIKRILKFNSTETDHKLWNIEQTPAEGTAYRFAKTDKRHYPDGYVSGFEDNIYLTNSTHLPVDNDWNIIDEIEFRAECDREYTGGTLFNYYANEYASPDSIKELIHKMCINTKLPYIAYTPTFGVCEEHGVTYGSDKCSTCGKEIDVHTRVVGYIRPIDKFNIGQLQQFKNRKYFDLNAVSYN
jgi:ribonucleoside-triphosphate reductase